MYEHLEAIYLPWLSIMLEMPSSPIQYFQSISQKCKNLKFVIACRPEYTEGPDYVFVLERDEAGTLIKVDSRVVHGSGIRYDQISNRINGPQDLIE